MLRRLYQQTMSLAGSRKAPAWLAVISFTESSVFPIPPDVVLAPMVLARPERAYWYATLCTIASVLGGILGYVIGYFLGDLGQALLALMGHSEGLETFQAWYAEWGLWVILIKGATPIPYKLVTITSGLAAFNFPVFIIASVVTRAARFFLVAFFLKQFGPSILPVIERRIYLVTGAFVGVLILGFLAVRLS
ncbi:MAG: YqaA family protein [Propylenella sp.]